MLRRIIFDTVLVISYLFVGWHVASLLAVIGLILFPHFFEAIIFGVFLDGLFGLSSSKLVYMRFGFLTIIATMLYGGAYHAKRHIRWYET